MTYMLLPDEGHWDWRPENFRAVYATTEVFLAQMLGGRCEPVGVAFKGSSIQVPVGADLVPGIAETLGDSKP